MAKFRTGGPAVAGHGDPEGNQEEGGDKPNGPGTDQPAREGLAELQEVIAVAAEDAQVAAGINQVEADRGLFIATGVGFRGWCGGGYGRGASGPGCRGGR